MRFITSTQLLLLGSAAALPELTIQKRTYQAVGSSSSAHLVRRNTLEESVYSILTYGGYGGAYYANVTIGTPPQNQVVILDTGSSDLYFDASSAPSCEETTDFNSCRGGSFNTNNSSTYKIVNPSPAFDTAFGDGSTATGPYSTDTLGIGNVAVENVQFGVAEEVNSTTGYAVGLMGIGYSVNEGTEDKFYPNVPDVLKSAGVIQSRLYSVYLNDVNYGSGSILFGGVDQSKYTGNLVTLDLLPPKGGRLIFEFITTVTALSISLGSKTSSIFSGGKNDISAYSSGATAQAVLLDTGSAAWEVPTSTYNSIVNTFTFVDNDGNCPCSYRDSGAIITLTFGTQVKITVPAQEFIVPVYNATTDQPVPYDSNGNTLCSFMISPGEGQDGFRVLGDAILRSMYVVFDLDNGQVSLAQANVNSTASSNVVEVGPSGVAAAISGVSSIAAQTYSIAQAVTASQTFVASTVATPIGTATGADALPTDARTAGSNDAANTGSTAAASRSTSKAAAATLLPEYHWGGVLTLAWMTFMAAGGAVLLV